MRTPLLLLLLLLLFTGLHAYSYNNELMRIYAKITPRLVLMSKSAAESPYSSINICILYEAGDGASADKLRALMLALYPKGLEGRGLSIKTARYTESLACTDQSLIFLLDTDYDTMQPALRFAKEQQIPTISYSNRFLSAGVIFSVHLGKAVRPYLNIKAAKENGITFNTLLIQISKIYSAEDQQ